MKAARETGGVVFKGTIAVRRGTVGSRHLVGPRRSRTRAARPSGVTGRCAALVVSAIALAAAAQASNTGMTVELVLDQDSATYDSSTFEWDDLNTEGDDGWVRAWDGLNNWWEVRYTDPYPVPIPDGADLMSVVVTVHYKMLDIAWAGTLRVYASSTSGSLGSTTFPISTVINQASWDITAEINAEGAGKLQALNDLEVRVTNSDAVVRVAWTYTKVEVQFNVAPAQPLITSPTADQIDVSRTPTIQADGFSDPDGDTHTSSDWEIFADDLLSNRVAYSLNDTTNLEWIDVDSDNVVFEGALAGRGNLDPLTEYWVTVTYRDEYGAKATSLEVKFTTKVNAPPDQATIASPAADETGVALNPVITTAPYSDPDGDGHGSTDWEVYDDAGLTGLVASSYADTTNLLSITIDIASGVGFEGSLSGKTSLDPATEYWVRARFTDDLGLAGEWSTAIRFEANAPPDQATIASPAADETVVALNPVITTAPYSDPDGDPHASTDWEIYDGADPLTANLVASSADDADNLTSIAIDETNAVFAGPLSGKTSLERATEYWVRARFTDDLSLDGDWPTPTRFETGDFPTTETWPFFGSGCSSSGGPSNASCYGLMLLVSFCAILLARTPLSRR